MAWIEVHDNLIDHPKTLMLADLLETTVVEAAGVVIALWLWAIRYAEDGHITKYPPGVIARACHWRHTPDLLLSAFTQAGFVDDEGGRLVIHDWEDYAGKLLARRQSNKLRAKKARKKEAVDNCVDCGGDGWVLDDNGKAERCSCNS